MNRALSFCSNDSLVIIDEFGKGTLEIDSIALLSSTVIEFVNKDKKCPLIFIVTNITKINQVIPKSKLVDFCVSIDMNHY